MEAKSTVPKVAAMLIVKASDDSEAQGLERLLKCLKNNVDAIYIQLNAPLGTPIDKKMRIVAERYSLSHYISTYVWQGNFVKARNILMENVSKKYDWLIWADTDDTIDKPENIRMSLAVMPDDVRGVFILYDYQKDEFGNTIVSHWTTRAVRNDNSYAWKSSFDDGDVAVHETLIGKREVRQVASDEWKVIHQADTNHYREALHRNIRLLEGMARRQATSTKGIDPRILFYLGSHNYDALDFDAARGYFIQYLEHSGWAEERAEAHIYMGKLFTMSGEEHIAKSAYLQAMGEYPNNPGSYLGLGKLEAVNSRWELAIEWFRRGIEVKRKRTSMVRYNYDYELFTAQAEALSNIGGKHLTEALKMAEKAYRLRPFDLVSRANRDKIIDLVDYRNNLRAVARLLRGLNKYKEEDKVLPLLDSLPSILADTPIVAGARQQHTPAKVWPKKSMAIYVGQGPLGIWGPWSLEKGIGGSEEAVIQLSRELAKLGWRVTVFATPGKKTGKDNPPNFPELWLDGIQKTFAPEWKQYWEFNPKDEFDVLVAWRNPPFFDLKIKARKKYLWLHDVMPVAEFTQERLANLDKVIVLSEYHRSLFPDIPDDKILLSANGIVAEDFAKEDNRYERDPHRMIYMSSHVRGLELIYTVWEDVKKVVPDATLDIYYGWESFTAILKDNPDRMAWRQRMMQWEKRLDGVTDHGRISHQQIVKEIQKSGIWTYPCPFPEIYCITAIKAQAGGAVPVSSNFAALDETVHFGTKLPMKAQAEDMAVGMWDRTEIDKYKKALITALLSPKWQDDTRPAMMQWARTQTWGRVAQHWDAEMAQK